MKKIAGKPMIELLLTRLSNSKNLDDIILATPETKEDIHLSKFVKDLGFNVFMGSEHDVLDRYYQASKAFGSPNILRITGDCPLVDPKLVDTMIEKYLLDSTDYVSNLWPRSFPKGLDTEVFSFKSLRRAYEETENPYDREHVTPYIRESGKFTISNLNHENNYSQHRWTVDWIEDFKLIEAIFDHFHPLLDFTWEDIMDLHNKDPELFHINKDRILI